jgi:hypothetical protein
MRCEVNVAILDLHGKPVDWGSTSKNIDREVSRYGNDNSEEFAHSFIGVKSGKYVIRVKATDHIGGKQANEYLPLHVLEAPDWTLPEEVRAAERKPAPAMWR